jgi:Flp pilus assembly protein TadD
MSSIALFKQKQSALLIAGAIALSGCATDGAMTAEVKPVYRAQQDAREAIYRELLENGTRYFAEGNYGLALAAFETVKRRYPRSVRALNGMGACYDKLGRYDLAQVNYHEALAIEPAATKVLNNLGYSLSLQGRLAEARAVYRLALKSDPDNTVARGNLSQVDASLPTRVAASDATSQVLEQGDAPPRVAAVAAVRSAAAPPPEPATPRQSAAARPDPVPVVGKTQPVDHVVSDASPSSTADGAGIRRANEPGINETGSGVAAAVPVAVAKESSSAPLLGPEDVTQGVPVDTGTRVAVASAGSAKASAGKVAGSVVVARQAVAQPRAASATVSLAAMTANAGSITEVATPVQTAPPKGDGPKAGRASEPAIAVANGNGRLGFARLVSRYLDSLGETVAYVVNARSFTYQHTQIVYPDRAERVAERLANRLPVESVLEPASSPDGGQVRVVLGQDMLSYEGGIRLAVESRGHSSPVARTQQAPLEVSNGNGRNGMAKQVSAWLRSQGRPVVRITNADSFGYERSVVFYSRDRRDEAQALASRLPVEPELTETEANAPGVGLRLVIGRDLLSFERALRETHDTNA